MESNYKTYNKVHLKRDNNTGRVIGFDNGKHEVSDVAKTNVRIEPWRADVLNKSWKNNGIMFIEIEEEKTDRKKLFEEAKELNLNPAKNIKTEDLIELINLSKTEGE